MARLPPRKWRARPIEAERNGVSWFSGCMSTEWSYGHMELGGGATAMANLVGEQRRAVARKREKGDEHRWLWALIGKGDTQEGDSNCLPTSTQVATCPC